MGGGHVNTCIHVDEKINMIIRPVIKRFFMSFNTIHEEKSLKAILIGAPNAGKSTLINTLVGRKIFPVSHKVHTTRQTGVGVFVHGNCQVILTDTPGLIPYQYGRRLKMPKTFLTGAQRSVEEAHSILVIVDSSNKRTRLKLDENVLNILRISPSVPAALVLNKVDIVKPKHVLLEMASIIGDEVQKELNNSYKFEQVFMISGQSGCGVDALKDYLVSSCVPLSWEYHDECTDQSPEAMVEEVIREKLLQYLDKEIPYVIKQSTVVWQNDEQKLTVLKNLDCKKSSQTSIVIGPKGKTIQMITSEAEQVLESMLNCTVDLTLNVRSINC